MTDRELLQLAAKAAGIPLQLSLGSTERNWAFFVANGGPCAPWNPLTDDGDAFRLMVMLQLDPYTYPNEADPCAATRRAITRAAAAMAKEKA